MSIGINIPEYEVTQFNTLLKEVVENNFGHVRIRGEISELKNASSGHIYLTLKDRNSILNATIWNQKKNYLSIMPEIGMEVIVTGKISTYAKSISTYSINIDKIELAGEGAILKLIEDRKKRLKQKGFFEDIHKKKIPYLPNKIGVITSSTGSVIHDIINRIKDRFPIDIDIWPVAVQGVNSATDIIFAIQGFNSNNFDTKPDVIIIARGGGSTEDLMSFNDEQLAIAVYDSVIPIISAIGHETDNPIIDYVSDLRASTPTSAAEKAVPMLSELNQLVLRVSQKLDYIFENKLIKIQTNLLNASKFLKAPDYVINSYKEKFNLIFENLLNRFENIYNNNNNQFLSTIKLLRLPEKNYDEMLKGLDFTLKNLDRIIYDKQDFNKKELNKLNRLLESNSINSNLKKGYSIVRKSNKIVNKASLIKENDSINIKFLDKDVDIKIKKIN